VLEGELTVKRAGQTIILREGEAVAERLKTTAKRVSLWSGRFETSGCFKIGIRSACFVLVLSHLEASSARHRLFEPSVLDFNDDWEGR
jgi:hypothetical protein